MANVNDLNFTVTLFSGAAKIRTFTLNYLLPHTYQVIEDYFLADGQEFYTDVEIVHAGKVVLRKSLVGNNSINKFGV